jgi:hypothetical protein
LPELVGKRNGIELTGGGLIACPFERYDMKQRQEPEQNCQGNDDAQDSKRLHVS